MKVSQCARGQYSVCKIYYVFSEADKMDAKVEDERNVWFNDTSHFTK